MNINWLNHSIELVVVFLGITAGFILQNFNETANDKKLEKKYMEGFKTDVTENASLLKSAIVEDSTWLDRYNYAIYQILDGSLTLDSAVSMMMGMANYSRFNKQDITYLNIVNSGNLGLIREYTLRQHIVAYHKELNDFEVLEDYYNDYNQNHLLPFMTDEFDLFQYKFITRDLYKEHAFTNAFGTIVSYRQQRITGYRNLLESTNGMIQELEIALDH